MLEPRAHRAGRRIGVLLSCASVAAAATITTTVGAGADTSPPVPPLPVFTPTPTNWGPNLAHWHSNRVTEADIAAERDMCEWFNAQFGTLSDQINAFNANLAANHDDYSAPGIQQQADAVTANIDQSEAYLVPRTGALGQSWNCNGVGTDQTCDNEINIYGGDSFKKIANQQQHISDGFKNHNPAFINNISIGLTNAYADKIRSQGVCA